MDPLTLLREFCVAGKLDVVMKSGNRIDFGEDYSFDGKMPTAFKSAHGSFYDLQSVYFFIKNKDLNYLGYCEIALAQKVEKVAYLDKKPLSDYLFGLIETHEKIAPPDSLPVAVVPATKRSLEGAEGDNNVDSKRPRLDSEAGDGSKGQQSTAGDGAKDSSGGKPAIQGVLAQERQLWDRNCQLICPGKDFSFAADYAKRHLADFRLKMKSGMHSGRRDSSQNHSGKTGKIPVRPSGRFERELPQNQVQNLAGPQFADMGVSLYGMRGADVRRGDGGANGNHDVRGHHSRRYDSGRHSSHRGDHHRAGSSHRPSRSEGGIPIILIPAGLSAKINMFNARYLLEEARYVPAEECRKINPKKKDVEIVRRSFNRKRPVQYQLMEKTPAKDSKDWNRVVAVVSQGVKWQFKDFPFKGAAKADMIETFTRIQGFYFAFHNEELSPLVKSWNVHTLVIHKDNRHTDITVMQEFFRKLDEFLLNKKSKLAY
ncbi:hypothetical protein BSKO_04601 [Bryopsis sp. KO-2023]|nr:hypothetical protein BSKO_04601 [Bryopsis sp. KO-2023]